MLASTSRRTQRLNEALRKRRMVLLLLLTVIGTLATIASLGVMSNLGAYP